jgi:hypothetical protein
LEGSEELVKEFEDRHKRKEEERHKCSVAYAANARLVPQGVLLA